MLRKERAFAPAKSFCLQVASHGFRSAMLFLSLASHDFCRARLYFASHDFCHATRISFDDLVAIARVPHPIHPELGRETPPRQWYCVLRRGRVGRCQVFQADARRTTEIARSKRKNFPPQASCPFIVPAPGVLRFASLPCRYASLLRVTSVPLRLFPRGGAARPSGAPQPNIRGAKREKRKTQDYRGVEQPGSSSGS